jgi:hypothetical protein
VCPTEITAFSDRIKEFEAIGCNVSPWFSHAGVCRLFRTQHQKAKQGVCACDRRARWAGASAEWISIAENSISALHYVHVSETSRARCEERASAAGESQRGQQCGARAISSYCKCKLAALTRTSHHTLLRSLLGLLSVLRFVFGSSCVVLAVARRLWAAAWTATSPTW